MVKRLTGKKINFKKILAGATLITLLPQVVYASNSPQKEKSKVSIILGIGKGIEKNKLSKNKSSEIELGIKYNRFALVGNIPISSHPNINLRDIEENIMENVYFKGREDLEDFSRSIGVSLEFHLPLAEGISKGISWVTGIGGHRESYTRKMEENLVRRIGGEESLLASNITSFPEEKEFVLNVYTGPSFKVAKGLELNVNLGYEIGSKKNGLKRGMYVSLRAILSFSRRGNR
jgi:hypothetical protein